MRDQVEDEKMEEPGKRKISVYIHVPFCFSKCSYCNFYSLSGREKDFDSYLDALEVEWLSMHEDENLTGDDIVVSSIFVGGGTPSLLGGQRLDRLLSIVRTGPNWAEDIEVTIEVNPESIDDDCAKSIIDSGYNRISIGIQSFKDCDLVNLGRQASRKQVYAALKSVKRAGFTNISIDMIYGLSGQTLEAWIEVLDEALATDINHISCYLLTPEEDTVLYRLLRGGEITTPLEETLYNQYDATRKIIIEAGYEHYEISNFAKPGFRCRHNEGTWQRQPYYGLGPSAHSFNGEVRWYNSSDLDAYLAQLLGENKRPDRERYRLDSNDVAKELIMVCMRRAEGVLWTQIEQVVTNSVMQQVKQRARFLSGTGFLHLDKYGMRLNPNAYFVSNSVFVELMRALEEDKS